MAKSSPSSRLYELAKRGAEVRVRFLVEELRLLFSEFPHLRDAFDRDELPIPFILKTGAERPAGDVVRRRKPTSAGGGKAAGDRMKRSWAARKAAEK